MSRLVIVVGSGSPGGLGQAVARRLLEAGDNVALVDIDEAGVQHNAARFGELAGTAQGFGCDVGRRDAVFAAAAAIEAGMGPAWGLVNAAVRGPQGPAEGLGEEEWRRGFDVAVGGTLWWCQAVLPQMVRGGGGRIVNFGSEASDRPTPAVNLNYIAAKGAIRSLTRGLAMEWGVHGITVNTVWPLASTPAQQSWAASNADFAAAQLEQVALHRFGDPYADVAPVVQFLLSPEAGFVTGATIPTNGGWTMP